MLADGAVAWLDIPLSCVIDRVPRDGRRPLAADLTQLEQLYLRRRAAYADAHVRIDASRPAASCRAAARVDRILGALSRSERHSRKPRGARGDAGRGGRMIRRSSWAILSVTVQTRMR